MGVVHRQVGEPFAMDWEGVVEKTYEAPDVVGVEGKVLIGPNEGDPNYYVRYFRVEPGGQTSLDQHEHDHGVYILHGKAEVLLGETVENVSANDVVYVPGNEVHQFKCMGEEPLGFLCVIPPK